MNEGARPAAFVAGDWGTSHLRLSLCDAAGSVLDRRGGPGVAQIRGDFPGVLAARIADWQVPRDLPIVLCGMVGSNIGWTVVPYLTCPVALADLADGAVRPARGVAIAPGLTCLNLHGAPDVLRGEETQVLGALALDGALRTGRHLLCLPGTHTKWVLIDNGTVSDFLTSVTGELFALLRAHSVLLRTSPGAATAPDFDPATFDRAAFDRAVMHAVSEPQASILHLMFECRSRQIRGEFTPPAAAAYGSGLLIAEEVRAAAREFAPRLPAAARTVLIGEPHLNSLYAAALAAHRVDCAAIDGAAAVVAGLTSLHARLFGG